MSTRRRPGRRSPGRTSSRVLAPAETESAGRGYVFEHPPGSGIEYALPLRPKYGVLRKAARAGNEFEQLTYLLEHTADAATLAAFDDMDIVQVQNVLTAWQQAMGAHVGESLGSST